MTNCIDCTAAQAAELLRRQERFTILIHRHPDGDTIGSMLALRLGLTRLGKAVEALYPNLQENDTAEVPAGIISIR